MYSFTVLYYCTTLYCKAHFNVVHRVEPSRQMCADVCRCASWEADDDDDAPPHTLWSAAAVPRHLLRGLPPASPALARITETDLQLLLRADDDGTFRRNTARLHGRALAAAGR